MNKINNVLWTGGWDSTFRIIQLYRLGAEIRPIYVLDYNRMSSKKELEVIHKLIEEIPLRFKQSKGKIHPLKLIKRQDIPADLFLKLIFKRLKKTISLGKQYYWLTRIAKKYPDLELSVHYEDMDRFFYTNQLIEINSQTLGQNWRINPKKVDFFKRNLFRNMTFPLIAISKPEMKVFAEENNFIDLMETTWFCHKSNEEPCGSCNPCEQYVRDGFAYRLQ